MFGVCESNTNEHYHDVWGEWYDGHSCNNDSWIISSNYPSGCKLDNSLYLESSSTICGNTDIPSIIGNDNEKGHKAL